MAMTATTRVQLPYTPRPLQAVVHEALDKYRWGVIVCHRRFGKTVLAINHLIKGALLCKKIRPQFSYIAPTYTMGKRNAWDYLKEFSEPVPGREFNETELRVNFPNGAQVKIFGADNPDSLRGIYHDGVVFDEYGLMEEAVWTEVVRPALADRQGWALFLGTPAGKNQFYEIADKAQRKKDWYFAEYRASRTNVLPAHELEASAQDMTHDEYLQEYECSFEASIKGAIYGNEVRVARDAGRLSRVPYDPILPVDTDWDLGIGDATAIWFSQSLRTGEIRLIDYYEHSGEGLPHYAQVLRDRRYSYGTHWAPHDIEVKELGTGRSRLETARSLGITFRVVPKLSLEEGIHAARMIFPRCWFDAERCERGIEALQGYRRDYNTRIKEFTDRPVHDQYSHGADAFRYLAVRAQIPRAKPLKLNQKDYDEYDAVRRPQVARQQGRARWR